MANKPLTVIASMQAKKGMEDKAKEALWAIVPHSRKDPGCINYDPHQSTEDPTLFFFYENWATKEDLDKHGETPHIQNLLAHWDDLFVEPIKGTFWEKLG